MAKGGVQQSDDSVSTTRVLTLSGGDTFSEVNAGVVRRGTLTGSIWIDRNGDGVRQDDLRDFAAALGRTLATGACYDRSMLAVNGADALAAGIREGVAVGAALEELLEKVIEGTLPNSRGVLLEQLASMGGTGADSCEQESLF